MFEFVWALACGFRTRRGPRSSRRERGAVSAEYAFLLMFVALVIIAGATVVGLALRDSLTANAAPIAP